MPCSRSVDDLNRVQHGPTNAKMTQAQADAIRFRVENGETQKAVAAAIGISRGLCCQIVKGDIWNPAKSPRGDQGERDAPPPDRRLRRRDAPQRDAAHADQARQLNPISMIVGENQTITAYEIVLPAAITESYHRAARW